MCVCVWLSSWHQAGQLGLREEQTTDQNYVFSSAAEATVCTVTLEKTSAGLGFSLEGGKGSLHGDKPLTINRIFKGGSLFPLHPLQLWACSKHPKPQTPETRLGHCGFSRPLNHVLTPIRSVLLFLPCALAQPHPYFSFCWALSRG